MGKRTIQCFLASSAELAEERRAFEIAINRKNKAWNTRGVFIDLVIWEDLDDTVSATRKQGDYNAAIRACDLFVMIYATKVGKYTREEFETALARFQETKTQPRLLVYQLKQTVDLADIAPDDLASLAAFQQRLRVIEHFPTKVKNTAELQHHFDQQLDKLELGTAMTSPPDRPAGSVHIGGSNTGTVNTGTMTITTGGGVAYLGPATPPR